MDLALLHRSHYNTQKWYCPTLKFINKLSSWYYLLSWHQSRLNYLLYFYYYLRVLLSEGGKKEKKKKKTTQQPKKKKRDWDYFGLTPKATKLKWSSRTMWFAWEFCCCWGRGGGLHFVCLIFGNLLMSNNKSALLKNLETLLPWQTKQLQLQFPQQKLSPTYSSTEIGARISDQLPIIVFKKTSLLLSFLL